MTKACWARSIQGPMERRHLLSLRRRRSSLAADGFSQGTAVGHRSSLAAMDVSVPLRESGVAGTIFGTLH
jgi:hypothetical protein